MATITIHPIILYYTNGYKFQGNVEEFFKAEEIVKGWGDSAKIYEPTPKYQLQVRQLMESFKYRPDTNYAKLDRIAHNDVEGFKRRVLSMKFKGLKISDWFKLFSKGSDEELKRALIKHLEIKPK